MTTAYIALGSNIGERAANLRQAVQLLQEKGVVVEAKSKIYQTQSVEGGGPDDFLNAVIRIGWAGSARELLAVLQAVESELGRPQPPRTGPRLIDLDILIFGDETHDETDLQVPHPRMHRRAFVLRPLLDVLEGGWVEPSNEQW